MWKFTPRTPACASPKSTSVPHSAEASALLAPRTPPQFAEFISDTRNGTPWAAATAASCAMRLTGGAKALEPSSDRDRDAALRGRESHVWSAYVWALKPTGPGPGPERRSSSLSSHADVAKPPSDMG